MKRKTIYFLFFSLLNISLFSQVTLTIESYPNDTAKDDTLYFASSINAWNPKDSSYVFKKDNISGKYFLELGNFDNDIFYKVTRGSWDKCETDLHGNSIPNRKITQGDTSLNLVIEGWHDHLYKEENTMSENVVVMTDSFYMPQFNRYRRIWIYKPKDYNNSNKRYPVVYMHDGQNLFNSKTSYFGEWNVDESMDELIDMDNKYQAIIVGIDNGGEYRIDELTPLPNKEYGGGEGRKYLEFITKTLKPHIDKNFRTLSDRENTYIVGSSLGGLISLYGVLSFRSVFSGAGVLSPSLWFNQKIFYLPRYKSEQAVKLFILAGDSESETMVSNINKLKSSLIKANYPNDSYFIEIVEGGKHNEELWRNNFKSVIKWLLNK